MTEVEFLEEYDLKLDEQQVALLTLQQHPMLVKGKSGSGKTFLFLSRIAYLLKSEMAQKEEMLNIVYDKRMAKEMTKQYRFYFGDDGEIPSFVDIYSFAYALIRRHCEATGRLLPKAYRDMSSVIRRLCKEMFAITLTKEQCSEVMGKISECRNLMMPEKQIAEIMIADRKNLDFLALYKEYAKFKDKKDIYDYDDILAVATELLVKDTVLLEDVKKHCHFVHVDDAQELSFLAHMLLKMVSSSTHELFLCADMDVSIAQHRAAYPQALDAFTQTYANGEILTRNGNYRNNATITDACNRFYYKDKEGLQSISQETCELKFKGFADLSKLYAYALKKVEEDEEETAFLYHDFAMAVPLIELFKEKGISFSYQGNMKHFLQDKFVRDMWNFIELLIDPRDMRAFYEVYEAMGLDISKRVLLEVSERLKADEAVDVYQALMESSYKQAGKKKLASLMERIRMAENKSTLDMVIFIKEKMGYNETLRKEGIAMNAPVILAFEILAQRYEDPDEFLYHLGALKDYQADPISRITICSLADAKGYEYDRVCILDCIRGILPQKEDSQKERMLFYHGMTRAKHELEFFASKRCTTHRLEISPYLYELHEKMEEEKRNETATVATPTAKKLRLTSLKRGMMIRHVQLGEGKIMKIADGMMHVKFADGLKQMNMKLCIANKLIELC